MLVPIEAASILLPQKNRECSIQCHNFPLIMGRGSLAATTNLKQLPSASFSTTYFMLQVLPVGDLFSLGLLSSVCVILAVPFDQLKGHL